MNQEVKEKWIAALRSGKYEQGQTKLRTLEDTYCCLGVLCDLAIKEGVIEDWKLDSVAALNASNVWHADGAHEYLPVSVQKWAGINSENPVLDDEESSFTLADENDNGASFHTISNLIEEFL